MYKKPTITIASSTEALTISDAVQLKLEGALHSQLWNDAFNLPSISVNTLVNKSQETDYAIFIFNGNDGALTLENGCCSLTTNAAATLGIMGNIIGMRNCFMLLSDSLATAFRLPTELTGMSILFFDAQDVDTENSVMTSCNHIIEAIKNTESLETTAQDVTELAFIKQKLTKTQSQLWNSQHDLARLKNLSQLSQDAIKNHFLSIAKPATPEEVKMWEVGATQSHLKEIKVRDLNIYYVDQDIIMPTLYGIRSISVIVKEGVRVYGAEHWTSNNIYYMDGFRSNVNF